jgi:hypothetical protein
MSFADDYMITSPRTSRVYTRNALLSRAMRGPMAKTFNVTRAQVGAVLDDHAWMRSRRGMTPSSVISDALLEASVRKL